MSIHHISRRRVIWIIRLSIGTDGPMRWHRHLKWQIVAWCIEFIVLCAHHDIRGCHAGKRVEQRDTQPQNWQPAKSKRVDQCVDVKRTIAMMASEDREILTNLFNAIGLEQFVDRLEQAPACQPPQPTIAPVQQNEDSQGRHR